MEIWTRSWASSRSPSARSPGKPPPRSRMRDAIALATETSMPETTTFQARRTFRAPTHVTPAVGCGPLASAGRSALPPGRPALDQRLEAASAQRGQPATRGRRGLAVEVDGHPHLGDGLPDPVGGGHRVGHLEIVEGHEGEHVEGAHPGMHAAMAPEVDVLHGEAGRGQRRSLDVGRLPDVGHHGAVVIGIGRPVEDLDVARRDGVEESVDLRQIPSLREVGDGFENSDHATR